MGTREDLKSVLAKEALTLTKLAELSCENGHKTTVQSISDKLKRGTIKHEELKFLLDIIGYKIEIKKK